MSDIRIYIDVCIYIRITYIRITHIHKYILASIRRHTPYARMCHILQLVTPQICPLFLSRCCNNRSSILRRELLASMVEMLARVFVSVCVTLYAVTEVRA